MKIREWVRLPTDWINRHELKTFKAAELADNTAALMLLAAIAHRASDESGVARMTYDEMTVATGISRALISRGLDALVARKIIECNAEGRSTYRLHEYTTARGWGKLPAKGLYYGPTIEVFRDFHLRQVSELDALKLYYLFVARRNSATGLANISYDKIEEYTSMRRPRIRRGLSFLAAHGLVHIEHLRSTESQFGTANAYRLAHLDPYKHMGTLGRSIDPNSFFDTQTQS